MQVLRNIFSDAGAKIKRATTGLAPSLHLDELGGASKWQEAQLIIFINPNNSQDRAIGKSLESHKSLVTAPILSYREGHIPKSIRNPKIILNSEADEKLYLKELKEASDALDQESRIRQEHNSIYFSATFAALRISNQNTLISLQNLNDATSDIKDITRTGNCSDNAPLKRIPNEPEEFAKAYENLDYVKAAQQRFHTALDNAQEILKQKDESDIEILDHALKAHTTRQKILIVHDTSDEYLLGLRNICKELNVSYALIKPA
ncbi:MAG: hypothetical protein ACOYK1_09995 [Vampirovibrionia bacterium]|jgi:hypothetical protein